MWKKIKKIIKSIIKLPFNIVKGIGKLIQTMANFIYDIARAFVRMIVFVLKSPLLIAIQSYKKGLIIRDYVMVKVDYLDAESKKWHRFFQVLASPYNLLLKLGFNPQMAMVILGIGTASGGTLVVAEVIQERSFANGDAGIYAAPSEFPDEELEKTMAWRKENPDDNTLRIVLGTTPVEEISITDVSVNSYTGSTLPSGKTEAILIEGKNGMTARLEIGEFLWDRNTCKSLTVSDVNVHKVVIQNNISDGQSIAQTAGTQRDLRISGGNAMARELTTSAGTYDRIWLDTGSLTSTNAKINKLTLSNIVSKSGKCLIRQADI